MLINQPSNEWKRKCDGICVCDENFQVFPLRRSTNPFKSTKSQQSTFYRAFSSKNSFSVLKTFKFSRISECKLLQNSDIVFIFMLGLAINKEKFQFKIPKMSQFLGRWARLNWIYFSSKRQTNSQIKFSFFFCPHQATWPWSLRFFFPLVFILVCRHSHQWNVIRIHWIFPAHCSHISLNEMSFVGSEFALLKLEIFNFSKRFTLVVKFIVRYHIHQTLKIFWLSHRIKR